MNENATAVKDWQWAIRAAQARRKAELEEEERGREASRLAVERENGAKLARALAYFGIDVPAPDRNEVVLAAGEADDARAYHFSLACVYKSQEAHFQCEPGAGEATRFAFTLYVRRALPADCIDADDPYSAATVYEGLGVSTARTPADTPATNERYAADLAGLANLLDRIDERWEQEVAYRRARQAAPAREPTRSHAEQLVELIRRIANGDEE